LRQCIGFYATVIAVLHFFGEDFSPGGVNTLTDDDKRLIKTDANFFGGRANNGGGHECLLHS
jgi:hypothetical protein